ncbi:MAG: radical SAM protein [Bacteroidales bacterium]|nr:radical SAM protein [Bacteroidales bacterium]
MKHYNIPIFTPQLACPHCCIYCNQRHISGEMKVPTPYEVKQTIDTYLQTIGAKSDDLPLIDKKAEIQVAFFGGSFTCLPEQMQIQYLEVVQPYIQDGKIQSIRLSTRPDYIDIPTLDRLKTYNVRDIELGAQSLDDEVLAFSERGHTCADVKKASELINSYNFNLGLQMMVGLPLDTIEKTKLSAEKIVSMKAVSTRIYPTLVIAHTKLAQLYKEGKYQPLTLQQGVLWAKEAYKIFKKNDVNVLRVGLHPSKDLMSGEGLLAGPFHVSFKELVLTQLWKDTLLENFSEQDYKQINKLYFHPSEINYAIGYNSENKKLLQTFNPQLLFLQREDIPVGTFVAE